MTLNAVSRTGPPQSTIVYSRAESRAKAKVDQIGPVKEPLIPGVAAFGSCASGVVCVDPVRRSSTCT